MSTMNPLVVLAEYCGNGNPVIKQEFTPGKGWKSQTYKKRASASWLVKLAAQGVTHIGVEVGENRIADFEIKRVLAGQPTPVPTEVKLTQSERDRIGTAARRHVRERGYRDYPDPSVLDAAADFIGTRIDELGRFDDLEYIVISDYAWSFARFLFPSATKF